MVAKGKQKSTLSENIWIATDSIDTKILHSTITIFGLILFMAECCGSKMIFTDPDLDPIFPVIPDPNPVLNQGLN